MSTEKAPIWAITSCTLDNPNDPSCVEYALTLNGVEAGTLVVQYEYNGSNTVIRFNCDHEDNDGAYITYLAIRALYENLDAMRKSTGALSDFEFPYEALEFFGRPLEFTY